MNNRRKKNQPVRVGLISLGCAKNLVDAEIMLGSLLKDGTEIINDPAQADAVIVNTCSFIDSAQEESVDAILESTRLRDAVKPGQAVIVSGCLPQRFRDELPKLMPEVDAFMGIDQVAQVGEIVQEALKRRAGKLAEVQSPKSKGQSRKASVSSRLAESDEERSISSSKVKSPAAHVLALSPREGRAGRESERGAPQKGASSPRPSPPLEAEEREKGAAPSVQVPLSPQRGEGSGVRGEPNQHRNSSALLDVHQRPTYIPDYATPRFRLTPKHFAYVKIAEGCNHPCSFCIIPRMRGSHRSRQQADIVQEARQLVSDGVKELNLISQDSTYYGLDLRPNHSRAISSPEKFTAASRTLPRDATTLCTLLRDLNAIEGDFWIRLLYTHPAHWTDELIQTIAECSKVARYVDMPLQHIHENMLERMRRETSQQYIVDLIAKIRAGIPGIALRTTFIVGFPGETEKYFETLLDFIRETKFERLGVFTYSKEDGTRAGAMAGQISDKVKQKRRELAMAEQLKVARAVSEAQVGRTLKVLVEGEASTKELNSARVSSWEHGLLRQRGTRNAKLGTGTFLVARGEADAPDIDGRVYVRGKLPIGEFAHVKIIGHTDYDLIGEAG